MAQEGLTSYERLPPGVRVLKRYRAGYTLVECSHFERLGRLCTVCRASGEPSEKRLFRLSEEAFDDEQLALG